MDSGFTIAKIRGVDVRVHWSLAFVVVLITWTLAEALLPDIAAGHSTVAYWVASVVITLSYFAGLLAHEFGHALVALREGVPVASITLWLFGGVARMNMAPQTARTARSISLAGPAVTLGIAVVAMLIGLFTTGLVGTSFLWFGYMNLWLLAFNLLPAYPLDGGRVYQAWRWEQTGNEVDATRQAATLGRRIGGGFILLGAVEAVIFDALGGIWLMLLGWFLREASQAELKQVTVDRPFREIPVAAIMTPAPRTVRADAPVDEVIADMELRGYHSAFPILGADGRLLGLFSLDELRRLPTDDRRHATVASAAIGLDRVVQVTSDAPVSALLDALGRGGEHRALVVDSGALRGIVSPSDITRASATIELRGSLMEPMHTARQRQVTTT